MDRAYHFPLTVFNKTFSAWDTLIQFLTRSHEVAKREYLGPETSTTSTQRRATLLTYFYERTKGMPSCVGAVAGVTAPAPVAHSIYGAGNASHAFRCYRSCGAYA